MNTPEKTPKIPDDQLLVFIGYANDAEIEAEAVYELEHEMQQELRRLRDAKSPIPYSAVRFWKWNKDASSEVGGQRTLIDPYILQARVAVFVFRDRVGK